MTKDGASTQTFPFEKDGNTIQMTVKNYFEKELAVPLRYNHVIFVLKSFISFWFLVSVGCFSPENFPGRTTWLETGFSGSSFNI